MSCGPNKHGLFKPSRKHIKFFKESFKIIDGANEIGNLSLKDWNSAYEQFFVGRVFLPSETNYHEIQYSSLGTQVTFLAMKVKYERKMATPMPLPDTNYIEYYFENEPDVVRTFSDMLVLTGTKEKRIPKIFLNNPNNGFNATVEFIIATSEVSFDDIQTVHVSNDTVSYKDLKYTNILSDSNDSLVVRNEQGQDLTYIFLDDISNIEMSGRIMIIDDVAIGKTNLEFISEFHALQAYSLINWVMSDYENTISTDMPADLTSPEITYANTFTTDILLDFYPVNGTNGDDGYLITKEDIKNLLIDEVVDNRDGIKYLDDNNFRITKVNENIPLDSITNIGKYVFIIDISDNAGNRTTNSFVLNIKDEAPPKIIINELGLEVFNLNAGTSGTSGTSAEQSKIYLEDFYLDRITNQDLINLFIAKVVDGRDGIIEKTIRNIQPVVSIGNTVYSTIESEGTYKITFNVIDTDNNITSELWANEDTQLLDQFGIPITELFVEISENQAPNVITNSDNTLYLDENSGVISKTDVHNLLITQVIDDRDGIITSTILNISLFKTTDLNLNYQGTSGTSGTLAYDNCGDTNTNIFPTGSTSGIDNTLFKFIEIPSEEVLLISEQGVYNVQVTVIDSDGAITIEDVSLFVLKCR